MCLFFIGKGKSFTPRPADRSRRGKPVMLFAFIVISSQQLSLSCPQPADRSGQRPVQTLLFVWRACGFQQPPRQRASPTHGAGARSPPADRSGRLFPAGLLSRAGGCARKKKKEKTGYPCDLTAEEALRTLMPWLFNWGPSSKAPKPPLDRFRAGWKPAITAALPWLPSSTKTYGLLRDKNYI